MRVRTVIAIVLLLVGTSMSQKGSTAQPSKSNRTIPRIEIELSPDVHGGSQPTCEMVLVDPQQRKTGLDNNGDKSKPWLEVPNSSYYPNVQMEDTSQSKRVITVDNPMQGEYWLGVYGKSDGVYRLAVRIRREDGSVFLSTYRASLQSLSAHTYLLYYSTTRVGVHRDSAPVVE